MDDRHFHIRGGGALRGRIQVPGDKSISHRAIMLAAIADGPSRIQGFLPAADTLATVAAFRALGVSLRQTPDGALQVTGVGRDGLRAASTPLDLGNSGTAMRLLAGLLAGQPFSSVLVGDESLSRRPMGRVITPLRAMGAAIDCTGEDCAPLQLHGGRLKGIDYQSPLASAQVKSCVLLAGLYAQGRTAVSEPHASRDHTERALRHFGYPVQCDGLRVALQGGGRLTGRDVAVPGDISSAAFFLVGASIAPDSALTLEGVGINPTRCGVLSILRAMGADLEVRERPGTLEPVADIHVRHAALRGIDIPAAWVAAAIDEFPALFVAAACASGTTRLRGARELRVKESDRIASMAEGLAALGAKVTALPDGMIIEGRRALDGGRVHSHGDHRVAMSLAMAALRCREAVEVLDCRNVATSFPGFADLARAAGLDLQAA